MERDLKAAIGFARSVLEHVLVALVSEDPTTRDREAERWAGARIPVPEPGITMPANSTPAVIASWAWVAVGSENPEARLAAARVFAALSWADLEVNLEQEAGALMAALSEACLPTVIPALNSIDPVTRRIAMHAVAFLGPRASSYVEAVASGLERFPSEVSVALVAIGGAATSWLVGAVRHTRREVRVAALKAIESPQADWPARVARLVLDALLEFLDEADEEMSRLAADALWSCGYGGDDVVAYYEENAQRLRNASRERLLAVIRSIRE
jgi:hypothetical protein